MNMSDAEAVVTLKGLLFPNATNSSRGTNETVVKRDEILRRDDDDDGPFPCPTLLFNGAERSAVGRVGVPWMGVVGLVVVGVVAMGI
jgi:hypothetical protein